MAAETIKEFLVGLGFKVDQAGLSRFASGIASASAKAMALGAAITAAAGAIVAGVKNIADVIAPSCRDDGVAYFIENYVLKED